MLRTYTQITGTISLNKIMNRLIPKSYVPVCRFLQYNLNAGDIGQGIHICTSSKQIKSYQSELNGKYIYHGLSTKLSIKYLSTETLLSPFVNATSVASDPVNLFEVHCSCLFSRKNLVSKLKLASTGSLVCWNLIGSSNVIGFLGVHSSGNEYSIS